MRTILDKNIIIFHHVNFSYSDELIIENADFDIKQGEFVSIIGPNGGGKSTMVKLILGQLKPQTGYVTVFGQKPSESRSRIGYMPQHISFDRKFPITVKEVVAMGIIDRCRFGIFSKASRQKINETLERLDLVDIKNSAFSELSGGQRQRVLIARALVSDPEILILDEPTNNVDPAVASNFYHMLRKLQGDMTIITVSHDLGFVAENVEKVLCVNRKVHIHPVSELNSEIIDEVYGSPHKLIRHDHCHGGHNCNHEA